MCHALEGRLHLALPPGGLMIVGGEEEAIYCQSAVSAALNDNKTLSELWAPDAVSQPLSGGGLGGDGSNGSGLVSVSDSYRSRRCAELML